MLITHAEKKQFWKKKTFKCRLSLQSLCALASDDFLCHLLKKLNMKDDRKLSDRVCVRMKEREKKTCQRRLENKNVLEINYSLSVSRQPPPPLISQLLQARKKRGKKIPSHNLEDSDDDVTLPPPAPIPITHKLPAHLPVSFAVENVEPLSTRQTGVSLTYKL